MTWSTERPNQAVYRQAYENIGTYNGITGKPYINPDVPMYVPAEGDNCVRIIDPIELLELQIYYFDVYFHRDVGFRKDYFLCLQRHNLGKCAICENATNDLWQMDKEAAKAFMPEWRRLMWVIDLKNQAEINILKLWSAPRTLVDEILAQSRDPQMDIFRDITNPYNGVPIYYKKTGKGRNTKYSSVQLGQQAYPVPEHLASQRFRFLDLLIIPTYEEVYNSRNMLDMPAEATPESIPISEYENDAYHSGYSVPRHEAQGAAEAAAASGYSPTYGGQPQAQPGPYPTPSQPQSDPSLSYDFSDLNRIQPSNQECFRQQFDRYNECAACPDRVLCSQPWPMIQPPPVREAKPSKTPVGAPAPVAAPVQPPPAYVPPQQQVQPPPAYTAPAQAAPVAPASNVGQQQQDNADRIRSAQEKLRDDIARRKASM